MISQGLPGLSDSKPNGKDYGFFQRTDTVLTLTTCADFGFNSWERATSRNFPFSQFPVSPTGFYVVPIEIERNQHVISRCELTCNLKVWMTEERQKF